MDESNAKAGNMSIGSVLTAEMSSGVAGSVGVAMTVDWGVSGWGRTAWFTSSWEPNTQSLVSQ